VRVKLGHRGQDIEMSVIDTGIGVAPQDLERIFERFYQVEDHMIRKHGGMGLGLSIVKGLAELHGGRVWAESVLGRGSRFVVVLPPRVSTAAATRSESSPFVS
jgi:signal transduction histidine kinase